MVLVGYFIVKFVCLGTIVGCFAVRFVCLGTRQSRFDGADYYGVSNRNKNINPFKATYRLAWTSNIPRRGKLGLEVLGDEKPEDSAVEKTEIVSISKEVLATGIVLQRGKLTLPTIRKVKGQLLFMRYHQN